MIQKIRERFTRSLSEHAPDLIEWLMLEALPRPHFKPGESPEKDAIGADTAMGMVYLSQSLYQFVKLFGSQVKAGGFTNTHALLRVVFTMSEALRYAALDMFTVEAVELAEEKVKALRAIQPAPPIDPGIAEKLRTLRSWLLSTALTRDDAAYSALQTGTYSEPIYQEIANSHAKRTAQAHEACASFLRQAASILDRALNEPIPTVSLPNEKDETGQEGDASSREKEGAGVVGEAPTGAIGSAAPESLAALLGDRRDSLRNGLRRA